MTEPTEVPNSSAILVANTLPAEHALLLREVGSRADAVLTAVQRGAWPQHELHKLLDYLYVELLQQVANEEWLLFRQWHHSPGTLEHLHAEHLELRIAIESITDVATHAQIVEPGELHRLVTGLCDTLQRHFEDEEAALRHDAESPSTASLGSVPHEWFSLLDGPVIDLATLPGAHGADAVLGRLLRMEQGERIELSASTDPAPLWRRLALADPDGYGYTYLQRGAAGWRVEIIRRPS